MTDKKVCGAKLRNKDAYCQKPPMENGRCRLHGGKTPMGPDLPQYKHGRYAFAFKGKLGEHFKNMEADTNPLDLLPELAAQRALLSSFIETTSAKGEAKKADLETISMLANDVVKTAATIVKARNDTALTIAEIKYIQAGMIRLMEKYVPDPDQRRAFVTELRDLIPNGDGNADGFRGIPAQLPAITGTTS